MKKLNAWLILPVVIAALTGAANAQVEATLVAEQNNMVPGEGVVIALRLEHQSGWHTYWKSPGTGRATKIEWVLPKGWQAGEIDWPVPHKIYKRNGEVSGHGYEGVIHLPVWMQVPADARVGTETTLKARVSWLVCDYDTCVSDKADLSITLPISNKAIVNNTVRTALAAASMPESNEAWEISASRRGDHVVLGLKTDEMIRNLHFFSHDELVWHGAGQQYQMESNGAITATMPIDKYYESEVTTLSGVLAFTDAGGRYRGVLVDVPVEPTKR